MGSVSNIDYENFPVQSDPASPGANYPGSRVSVCFHYDTDRRVEGTCVRDDVENPFVTIFKLDDGRHILSTECQYQPLNSRNKGKIYALLSKQGTICPETALYGFEFTETRKKEVEISAGQELPDEDRPMPGTWVETTEGAIYG